MNEPPNQPSIDSKNALTKRTALEIKVIHLRLQELNNDTLNFGRVVSNPSTDAFYVAIQVVGQIVQGLENELRQSKIVVATSVPQGTILKTGD